MAAAATAVRMKGMGTMEDLGGYRARQRGPGREGRGQLSGQRLRIGCVTTAVPKDSS